MAWQGEVGSYGCINKIIDITTMVIYSELLNSFGFSYVYIFAIFFWTYNCINYIEKTANNLGFNIATIKSDCLKYLKNCKQEFDFIFADPPYDYDSYQELKNLIFENKLVKKGGLLIIEHDKETQFEGDNLELRKYGTLQFSIFSF